MPCFFALASSCSSVSPVIVWVQTGSPASFQFNDKVILYSLMLAEIYILGLTKLIMILIGQSLFLNAKHTRSQTQQLYFQQVFMSSLLRYYLLPI
jgi:hypothetical protein